VENKIADGRVLELIRGYLKQGVMDSLSHYEAGEEGTPQGAVISPLLANIYLDPLDQNMAASGCEMVRYADDFIILCHTQEEAQAVLKAVQQWTAEEGLTLHPEKTRIVDVTQIGGFDFLGYHFERGKKTPRKKSLEKFQNTIRSMTKRTSGQSMKAIISELKPKMRGWFEYFKHSRGWVFKKLDKWIRGRLRGILKKRDGRKGRERQPDHYRWPNSTFTALGFFSLEEAWNAAMSLRK
jgi:RNA-directed DNA polymerase